MDAGGIHFIKEQRFPYIRLGSLGVEYIDPSIKWSTSLTKVTFTGWQMKFWPEDAMTSAILACSPHRVDPGELDFDMLSDPDVTPEPPSRRNMSTQCFKTAGELVLAVMKQGWQGIEIIEGSQLMCWCVWAMCRVNGFKCEGYTPDDENDAMGRYARAESLLAAYNQNQHSFDLGVTLGAASGNDALPFDFPEISDEDDA